MLGRSPVTQEERLEMITRNEVLNLYRLILDRQPESEQVINEKRTSDTVGGAAAEMLMSDEFISNNNSLIAACLGKA
jgi:hypothetical protein